MVRNYFNDRKCHAGYFKETESKSEGFQTSWNDGQSELIKERKNKLSFVMPEIFIRASIWVLTWIPAFARMTDFGKLFIEQ